MLDGTGILSARKIVKRDFRQKFVAPIAKLGFYFTDFTNVISFDYVRYTTRKSLITETRGIRVVLSFSLPITTIQSCPGE